MILLMLHIDEFQNKYGKICVRSVLLMLHYWKFSHEADRHKGVYSLINTEIWRGHWCTVATSKVANSFEFADAWLYKFHSDKIWSFILVLFLKLNCQFLANFDQKFLFIQFAFKKLPTSLCCLCFLLLYICLVKYFSSLIMYYNHC